PPPHVLREGRQGQLLGDLGLGHEGAAAVAPRQVSVADELVDRGPQRQARDAQLLAELPLGRDRLADLERFDEAQDPLPGLVLLTQCTSGPKWSSPLPASGAI